MFVPRLLSNGIILLALTYVVVCENIIECSNGELGVEHTTPILCDPPTNASETVRCRFSMDIDRYDDLYDPINCVKIINQGNDSEAGTIEIKLGGINYTYVFGDITSPVGKGVNYTLSVWSIIITTSPPTTTIQTTIETTVPDTTVPATTVPDTTVPDTTVPDTTVPDTTAPDTTVPEITVPDTTVPDTTVPDTTVPDTTVPDTTVPDTTVPDTTVPDTTVPDTTVPDTTVPDTTVPDTSTPEVTTENDKTTPSGNVKLFANQVLLIAIFSFNVICVLF